MLNEAPPWSDLEPLDHREATVVAEERDQLVPGDHGAQELGVEHQVRAVADEREHLAPCTRHARAPRAGQLIAHAREAVLAVEGRDPARSLGCEAERVDSIDDLPAALQRGRAAKRNYVIAIRTAPDAWTKGGAFWQVGVPEVSEHASSDEARARQAEGRSGQRIGW